MKNEVYNPYLPLHQYVPDGEPHVFGDRVYVYGSHDKEGGDAFCMLDYEVFSAPTEDLSDWRSEGIAYRKEQDPFLSEKYRDMYAPDVVCGNDGRYYLYYALAGGCFTGPIHVAVSDKPAGPFEYYGFVKNEDGSVFTRNITFDPGVINDNGIIRLYYGWSLSVDPQIVKAVFSNGEETKENDGRLNETLMEVEMQMFEKTREEIEREPEGIMGAFTVELANDMVTVKTEPVRIVPGQFDAVGTTFENHAFFEASSMRKIGDLYYFIYSSQMQHELCYATSHYPDRDFVYRGVIVSNGDIGYDGRKEEARAAATGNNHGSIECIQGQWYVFYHRQTHKTTYSRQGCAEKIEILEDGSIPQVQMTSCGLNQGALKAQGKFSAVIACNLTNGHMPHIGTEKIEERIPYIDHAGEEHFIADISNGTLIGYKYFSFDENVMLKLSVRGSGEGSFFIMTGDSAKGQIAVESSKEWKTVRLILKEKGTQPVFLKFEGTGFFQLKDLIFEKMEEK